MIDWKRVQMLRDEIGEDDFAEVAVMFLQEADDAVMRLSPGAEAAALEADLHSLKGSALNLGFRGLSDLCQDGERRAAAGRTDIDLVAVRTAYSDSKHEFLRKLAPASAA